MNYQTLMNKINKGDYNSKLPFPPYRTDNKIRIQMKDVDLAQRKAWRDDENRLRDIFMADLRNYIESEIGKHLTDRQFGVLYSNAYEYGHSNGYSEILNIASDLANLVKVILEDK